MFPKAKAKTEKKKNKKEQKEQKKKGKKSTKNKEYSTAARKPGTEAPGFPFV